MLERLLESWLDNASERSYQVAFCQLLAAEGHRVVHSTRHHPIEFGKDIISVAPDGVPCAYQLKGNPGGRLTLEEFRQIQPQLWQLATQSITFPGVPRKTHRSYLVTNGYVEEDVQKSLSEINCQLAHGRRPHPRIELITRGDLLLSCTKLGSSLWPSGREDVDRLLRFLVHDGHDLLPLAELHKLLSKALYLDEDIPKVPTRAEGRRVATSTAILLSTALREFSRVGNHFAAISGWTLYCAYVIAMCERHGFELGGVFRQALDIAIRQIKDELCALCDETDGLEFAIEGDGFADFAVYQWRAVLLRALMSLLWFWLRGEVDESAERRRDLIEAYLAKSGGVTHFWGEAATPQLLATHWKRRASDPTMRADLELAGILKFVLASNCESKLAPLANPYYSYEDVFRNSARGFLSPKSNPLEDEAFKGSSFFALSLFHLLVRTGLKAPCFDLWPDLTRLGHKSFLPAEPWRYCLWRSAVGTESMHQLPLTRNWLDVKNEARSVACGEVPKALRDEDCLLLLFVIVAPFRATPNVVRFLGWRFNEVWFLDPPLNREATVMRKRSGRARKRVGRHRVNKRTKGRRTARG